jgi:hypothetical protein
MDVKDWLKVLTLAAGVVLVTLGVTVGAAHGAILVPLGVGLVTAAGVKSTGVTGLVAKVKGSIPPGAL